MFAGPGEAVRGTGPAPACTFAAATVGPSGLWAGWIGDSRAYWLPDDGTALRLTEDDHGAHEALAAWLGADADEPRVRIRFLRPFGPGRVLLCTDGLWRYLPGAAELRAKLGGGDLRADARALVGHALAAGGHDNVTAVLLRVEGP
ncbi:protein phosphatase 2C domain-containing protein [Actinomadura rayongensis]|uniref:PPM-type phosphatase domain-containing protein n=1 Tax=Actinomadura rayongensis TaxID=1429076 RepID=A0A6I4WAT2_9ACTN|nr:hypothetical protein [Actinomadura rayongensis]